MSGADVTAVVGVPGPRLAPRTRAVLAPLLKALVVGLLVVVITFALGKLVVGNPGRLVLGPSATPSAVNAYNAELGLDDPTAVQFARYFGHLLTGDLGTSFAFHGKSVWSIVGPGLAVSAQLAGLAIVVSVVVALVLGIVAATTRSRSVDVLIRAVSVIGLSTPSAFVGLVLILVVAVGAGVLPAGGWGTDYPSDARFLVLPVATLSIYLTPILLRAVRERALAILDEPHVEAAIARGLPRRQILLRHVLPNCAGPVLTILGFNVGNLLSGAIIVEVVFGLPGLGRVASTAAASSDLPVLQGVALLSALLVTLANVAAETAQRFIDPRLR